MLDYSSQVDIIKHYGQTFSFSLVNDIAKHLDQYEQFAAGTPCDFTRHSLSGFQETAESVMAIGNAFSVKLEDRYDDIGTIAYFSAYQIGNSLHVDNIAASTRVFHKEFEKSLVAWASATANDLHVESAFIHVHQSSENADSVTAFGELGLENVSLVSDNPVFKVMGSEVIEINSVIKTAEPVSAENFRVRGNPSPDLTVYVIADRGDEIIDWGADISQRAETICVSAVLVEGESGNGSDALRRINTGDLPHGFEHVSAPLTTDAFICAQNNEFIHSCMALGIPQGNIHVISRQESESNPSDDHGQESLHRMLEAHPLARVCMNASWRESDDTAQPLSGAELQPHERSWENIVKRIRAEGPPHRIGFAVPLAEADRFQRENPDIPLFHAIARAIDAQRIDCAAEAYRFWDPNGGRFAIGWLEDPARQEKAKATGTIVWYDPDMAALPAFVREEILRESRGLAYALNEMEVIKEELEALRASTTFKVGRVATAIPRKLKDTITKRNR